MYEKDSTNQLEVNPQETTLKNKQLQKKEQDAEQSETYPGRGYFIAVESPRGNTREASFTPELMTDLAQQDKLMAQIIRGRIRSHQNFDEQETSLNQEVNQPPLSSLSSQIINKFNEKYLNSESNLMQGDTNTTSYELNLYQLLLDTIPDYFKQMNDSQILNTQIIEMMFKVAASDGIDTAISTVLLDYPFSEEKVDLAKKQIKLDNERFFNMDITHPTTEEPIFAKCAGFKTAKALENQLIIAILEIEKIAKNKNLEINNNIPRETKEKPSIGETTKEKILSM